MGVAPTRQEGRNKGTHFFSSPGDNLRNGLFRLLSEEPFCLPLVGLKWQKGIRVFIDAQCFFVHAAKVRPVQDDAPPLEAIAFCANRHLLDEIEVIQPKALCIISKTKVAPLTSIIFGAPLSEKPRIISIGSWSGLAAIAPQPVRGNAQRTKEVLLKLWPKAEQEAVTLSRDT